MPDGAGESPLLGSGSSFTLRPGCLIVLQGNDEVLLRSSWKASTTCTPTGSSTGTMHRSPALVVHALALQARECVANLSSCAWQGPQALQPPPHPRRHSEAVR